MYTIVQSQTNPTKCYQVDENEQRQEVILDVTTTAFVFENPIKDADPDAIVAQTAHMKEDGVLKLLQHIQYAPKQDQ
jgi:hypothetical protein